MSFLFRSKRAGTIIGERGEEREREEKNLSAETSFARHPSPRNLFANNFKRVDAARLMNDVLWLCIFTNGSSYPMGRCFWLEGQYLITTSKINHVSKYNQWLLLMKKKKKEKESVQVSMIFLSSRDAFNFRERSSNEKRAEREKKKTKRSR